jgi:superfamily II DNA or RNA helicase
MNIAEKKENSVEKSVEVEGSWGTKIESIIRLILGILKQNYETKILLFSEWAEMLEIISRAFQKNNIGFSRINTGKKYFVKTLETWKKSPHLPVLLLPIKTGSNGLNLIEANHIILVEPLLNPGMEAQAMGRVDRQGQTQKTFVHRFLMKNTIEIRVAQLARTRGLKKKGQVDHNNNEMGLILSSEKNNEENNRLLREEVEFLWFGEKKVALSDKMEGESKREINGQNFTGKEGKKEIEDSQIIVIDDEETPGRVGNNEISQKYWSEKVIFHGKEMQRQEAKEKIEVEFSWELKEQGSPLTVVQKSVFMEKEILIPVAKRLFALEPPGSETTSLKKFLDMFE